MKKKLRTLTLHPLITGSFTIFIGTFIANIGNFLFNFFMASNLSLSDYGILASMISLITLSAYVANAIAPPIVQFGGKFFAENDLNSVVNLYRLASKFQITVSLFILLILVIFVNQIATFFNITSPNLIIITGFTIFISILMVLNISLLQAKLAFTYMSFLSICTSLGKLIFGTFLVYTGFKSNGAVIALLLSSIIPYFLSFIPIRFVLTRQFKSNAIRIKDLLSYGIPSAISLLALTSLITSDILLVKHFFTESVAGMYAGLSLVGRVIFFFSAPIGLVMFPLVVRKYNKKENYTSTFLLALVIVLLLSLSISFIYFIFPDLIILLFLKQKEYLTISPLLGLFSLLITSYSIISIIVNFYISIKSTKVSIFVLVAAISQIVLINIFHNSLKDIIKMSFLILLLLLISLLLYYPYATKKK